MSWEFLSTAAADVEWGRVLEKLLLSGESPSLSLKDILVPIRILELIYTMQNALSAVPRLLSCWILTVLHNQTFLMR